MSEKFKSVYEGKEAKEIFPAIKKFINENWKAAKFVGTVGLEIDVDALQDIFGIEGDRRHSLVFVRNRIFGSPDYTRILFNESDIVKIEIHGATTQIIIRLKNKSSIWLHRNGYEHIRVEIGEEEI